MKQVNSSDDISWRRQSTKSDALLTVKNFDNILCRDPINGLKEIDELLGIKSPSELKVGEAEILASETLISDSDKFALYEAIKNITFVSESQKQKISKSIMAPMVSNSKTKDFQIELTNNDLKNEKENLLKLRKYIEKNFEYV